MPDDDKPRKPAQLTRGDLATMSANEIVEAKARGELDHLLDPTRKDDTR